MDETAYLKKIFMLEAEVATLTELLAVEEKVVGDQSAKLELTVRALDEANEKLEIRVKLRTAELLYANQELQREVNERKRAEETVRLLNEELEQRVISRTRQLETTNNDLRQLTRQLETAYTELKLAQSRKLQQEKMASIGQLAAGVAHEINNPMGFVISNLNSLQKYADKIIDFIEILSESLEKVLTSQNLQNMEFFEQLKERKQAIKLDYIMDDMRDLIKESLEGADRVKKIVQDLKSFSRVDAYENQMADINAGLESTINIVWNELKYKATVNKELGLLPLIRCDLGQLNQVFMNILINAVQAIPKQGQISVKTWCDSSNAYIAISDDGIGIPRDKIDKIFEPFYTTKEVGKGTGLGLSMAYDIIKRHNGQIKVDSEMDKGTTFTIAIPILEENVIMAGETSQKV